MEIADFTVDLAAKRVTRTEGDDVRLTPTEWQLLEILVRNRDGSSPSASCSRKCGGPRTKPRGTTWRLSGRAPPQAGAGTCRPQYPLTEPGMGYRFQV